MAVDRASEDPGLLSPELVLVASPEETQRALAQLPEPPWSAAAVVRPARPAESTPVERTRRRSQPRLRLAVILALAVAGLAVAGYLARAWRDSHQVSLRTSVPPPAAASSRPAVPAASVVPRRPHPRPAARTAPKAPRAAGGQKSPAARKTTFVPARTWAWVPVRGAAAYEVTFVRAGRVVFRARSQEPRVLMPRRFRFRPGTYRWTVRALPKHAGTRPIVDSTFSLTAAGATAANTNTTAH